MYYDICKLAVLSGIEIDRAKKEYELDSGKIIKELKNKWSIYKNNKLVKPMFFKMITQNNGYQLNKNHEYKYFNTPMDYLQKEIGSFNFRESRKYKEEFLSFSEIVRKPNIISGGRQYEQKNRILSLIKDLKKEVSKLYVDYNNKSQDEKDIINKQASEIKQQCVEYINNISLNETAIYLLLKSIEDKENANISRLILNTLFGTPNKIFFTMIKNTGNIKELVENKYGSIKIFGFNFIKSIQNLQKTA